MANITGTSGVNNLIGTQNADVISALGGNDTANGLGGNDQISGDRGNDTLLGGAGNDTLNGGVGNDSLSGQAGTDTLNGDTGNDTLNGGAGGDSLNGGAGNDSLSGSNGNDQLLGSQGNDILNGDAGNDSLTGGVGNDSVSGGSGNDILIGVDAATGLGSGELDTLTGGRENDRFVLAQGTEVFYDNNGNGDFALITDFDIDQDVIQLIQSSEPASVSEIGDAGQLLTNAQVVPSGSATLESITGEISSNNDVDLFQITLNGEDFSATTVNGAEFDTQLFLFDEDGSLIAQNDDFIGLQSTLSNSSLDAGTYFLAISSFNNDAVASSESALTGFTGTGLSNGEYTINLAGVESTAFPGFSVGASPTGLPSGTGIFFEDDLIAIVQGDSFSSFSEGFV